MTFQDFDIHGLNFNKPGNQMVICPKCSHDRKKKTSKPLSVNIEKRAWNCHHCGWKGKLPDPAVEARKKEQKNYIKPTLSQTALSDKTLQYFLSRGISSFVINRNKITESTESMLDKETGKFRECLCINFNYFREGELVNTQFRDSKKNFKLVKDAELIPYGLDDIKGLKEFLCCEGQFDKLAWEEAGFVNCISVPNGASLKNNNLSWIDNCWETFAIAEKIYLCTDGDAAGLSLRSDLAHRVGLEKCWTVSYPENCKDANEVLLNPLYGKEKLQAMIADAKPWPLTGVADKESARERWIQYYTLGAPNGEKVGMGKFDNLMTFKEGLISVWTGQPNSGKSDFVDEICVRLAVLHDWKFGVYSPENWPIEVHITKLIEKFIGIGLHPKKDIDDDLLSYALWFITEHFYFVEMPDEEESDFSVSGLTKLGKEMKLRYGIKGLIIDPWNTVEHDIPQGLSETLYISKSLGEISRFAKRSMMHVFIIAHPYKLKKDAKGIYPVATLYDISGSANWYNKADFGVSVYRLFDPEKETATGDNVQIHVQKVRFKWMGRIGNTEFEYDYGSGLYIQPGSQLVPLQTIRQNRVNYRDITESQNEPNF